MDYVELSWAVTDSRECVPSSRGTPDYHVQGKIRVSSKSCSQRALGSNSQGKASRPCICKPKEKGNTSDLRKTMSLRRIHPSLSIYQKGLNPEIVPSAFEENLGLSQFEDLHEYPVATANHKAVEVYRRLVVCPA